MTVKELLRLCLGHGWTLDRINGSHHILIKDGYRAVPIPIHGNRDLPRSLEPAIRKQTGLKGI